MSFLDLLPAREGIKLLLIIIAYFSYFQTYVHIQQPFCMMIMYGMLQEGLFLCVCVKKKCMQLLLAFLSF